MAQRMAGKTEFEERVTVLERRVRSLSTSLLIFAIAFIIVLLFFLLRGCPSPYALNASHSVLLEAFSSLWALQNAERSLPDSKDSGREDGSGGGRENKWLSLMKAALTTKSGTEPESPATRFLASF